MKNLVVYLFLFSNTILYSQQAYYNDVDLSLYGIALKEALATKIISTHTNSLSYSEVWSALKITDQVPNNSDRVLLVYGYDDNDGDVTTDRTRAKNNNGGNVGQWNREHTYPKSLGTPPLNTSGPGADAHMLRPCDVQRNGTRGNKKFINASGHSKVINSNYWYPGDEWKGDIARMMMYMYLRYDDRCLPDNVGVGNSVSNDLHMIALFLDWNAEDPVSQVEINRNNYLVNTNNDFAQGNRNPFIDNPYLATRIWGGPTAEDLWEYYLSTTTFNMDIPINIFPNPVKNELFITSDTSIEIQKITLYTSESQLVFSDYDITSNRVEVKDLSKGLYYLLLETNKGSFYKKILILN